MRYQIKALRGNGQIVTLSADALNADEAARQVAGRGDTPLSIRAQARFFSLPAARPSPFPLVLFSHELLALLDAGLGLVEALEALAEKEHHAAARDTLQKILVRLYEGWPLSMALEEFPAVFPALYIATVRASEKTGALSEALGRYVTYQLKLDSLRKKIVSASIYPVLLLVTGSLVVLFLMAYVVPKFASVYEGAGRELPLLSRLLLDWGQLLQSHGTVVAAAAGALMLGVAHGLSSRSVRQTLLSRLWRIPALGERLHAYQLARFYRTLGMLLKAGVPVVKGLEMVAGMLQQPVLRERLQLALESIREGRSVSQAMEAGQLVTPVALRMLRVGERAGNMGEMMERIAAFHDEEMARWVDWATRLFEPLLMALIGLVIGAIVVLMYLPIFELAGSLQ